MIDAEGQIPRDNVTGLIVVGVVSNGQRLSVTPEVRHQIQDATMIDVRIHARRAPFYRVVGARCFHVFMNLFLQIDTGFTKRTNYYVRTNTGVLRHIATWIIERDVCWIVAGRHAGLRDGAFKHLVELRWDVLGKWSDSHIGRHNG